MAAGDTTQGRRVPAERARDFFTEAEPGDYCGPVSGFTGDRPAIFFKLPDGGFGHVCEPPHAFEESADGTVTVSPSILHRGGPDMAEEWHGYLEAGVWREV